MEQQKEKNFTEILLKKRSELKISGVYEIISSDENSICLNTGDGALMIEGEDLRIISMNVAGGDLIAEGRIDGLAFNERTQSQKSGFFARMFK